MNKKVLLLPIIGSFLLTGCKLNLFGKTIYLFEKPEKKQNEVIIDDGGPEEMHRHATSLSYNDNSPSAPFYLKVGEVREIGVTLTPSPDLDEEKTVSWRIDKEDYVEYTVVSSDTKKVTVKGLKPGQAVLTATNDYNKTLTYSFTIKVIEYDEDNDYLWQYSTQDRKQFGYIYQERPQGVAEGDATLNGVTWHFTRSNVVTLQSSMGAVGFGRGSEPETHVHLETDNIRAVEKFTIEAASARSQAKMTITVGDTVFMDQKTVPSDYYDEVRTIYSDDNVEAAVGKIQIDVYTPAYDPSQEENPNYQKPGAFFLKSILINFADDTPVATEKTYNYKEMYDDTESDFYTSLPTNKGTRTYEDSDFSIEFAGIKKETEAVPGYPLTNGDITIKPVKSGEVFYKVEVKFFYAELTSVNNYKIEKSKTDGLTYFATGAAVNKDVNEMKISLNEDHINNIRIKASNSTFVGIEYIKISTLAGNPWTVKSIDVPSEYVPNKTSYLVGESFSPEGLPDLEISFNESGSRPEILASTALTWYTNSELDKTTFELGQTVAYGAYNGELVATVTGITVQDQPTNITLVKDVAGINTTDHYYIFARSANRFLRGSAGGSVGSGSDGVGQVTEASEDLTLSGAYKDDYFVFEMENGKYAVKSTTGHYIGMTNSGNLSRNKNPNVKFFTLAMNPTTYELTMRFEYQPAEGDPIVRYMAFGSTAMSSLSETEKANLSLYKVVS